MRNADPLREFLSAYLSEVDEHISSANARLLALEASMKKGEANPRAVRELFRGLHTIKGLSAMVGVEPVVDVSHAMESALRVIDERGAHVDADAIEALFQGLRAVETRVRALAAGSPVEPAPGALIGALEAMTHVGPAATASLATVLDLDPALEAKLAEFERTQLREAPANGKTALRVDFAPSAARAEAGITINRVRAELEALGDIVRVLPVSRPAAAGRPAGVAFAILFVTDKPLDLIARVSGLEESPPHVIAGRAAATAGPSIPIDDALEPTPNSSDPIKAGSVRVEVSRLDTVIDELAVVLIDRMRIERAVHAVAARGVDVRELQLLIAENARHLRALRSSILTVRMVPVSEILERLPLVVRGLNRASGKQVRLDVTTGRAEFDKGVAERIFPALMHLVRNAFDHGIEGSDTRTARNKPAEGTVKVIAHDATANWIDIEIVDDGGGIDREALAQRAGKPVPRDDGELMELLCTPGLSTRSTADATSGRGMGMDIVRRIIVDVLGGTLSVRSTVGEGTAFALRVPLSVSIIDALVVEAADQRFAIPLTTVEEIVEVSPSNLTRTPAQNAKGVAVAMISRRGQAMPYVQLARLLQFAPKAESTRALIVATGAGRYAVGVDRLVGQQEAVVKPMDDVLVRVPGVIGATQLGDGQPTLMLDLVTLAARSRQGMPAGGAP